ncbi:MAG TPA: AmmeMemoRadiSam system radical SAM enzyme [Clostridia bacterium]|nr:AmmeMemoRadiSam system radical SAM enzyme [Clostridia bacterium]
MKLATHWVKKENGSEVRCLLCPHGCVISEGKQGRCRVRKNVAGKLYLLNYGLVTSLALDPIEKKPLKRFFPGKQVFSLGTFGCNFACSFCQNWQIAHQKEVATHFLAPEEAVAKAKEFLPLGNVGIAYTYSEPLMWFEYVLETAKLAKEAGLKNVLVTNGYLNPQPLKELLPFLDAVNLDIKAFTQEFYEKLCQGRLAPVLHSAKLLASNCHLEVTTLLIPQQNDSPEEIAELAQWIAQLDRQIPLHLTRYFPNYKLQTSATARETMLRAKKVAEEYLDYVYLGNI